ncbi:MAG: hypothetical protein AAF989_08355 [Planctomycetota bacterium]
MMKVFSLPVIVALFAWILLMPALMDSANVSAQQEASYSQRTSQAVEVAKEAMTKLEEAGKKSGPNEWVRLGEAELRAGKIEDSIVSFERAISLAGDDEFTAGLWQYGISLFFAKRYDEGTKLFDQYQQFGPDDVETAAWHFMCMAKAKDVETARQNVIEIYGDGRPAMKEVHQRLSGGEDSIVHDAIRKAKGTPRQGAAIFFGNFYLGAIADAEGDLPRAKRRMKVAAISPYTEFMADVAKVYSKQLDGSQDSPQ